MSLSIPPPSSFSPNRSTYPTGRSNTPRSLTVPSSLGVHVHFLVPGQGRFLVGERELDLLKAAGFSKVRMDVLWSEVEKQPGVFYFRKYDAIIQAMKRREIQPMVILGLGNPLYSKDLTLQPPAVQAGYERYATETVRHFRGQGIIWELVNEPNHESFWQPEPNPDEYMRLAWRLLPRLRQLDPTAKFTAPGIAGSDPLFLQRCFQQGLLRLVDGVTIHPYQAFPTNKAPEKFLKEYNMVQQLVRQYQPPGKQIPVLLGEWGYSSAAVPKELDEATQASFLVRQSLLSLMMGSPVNILYDWKGDINGQYNPRDKEHGFGLLAPDGRIKPAYGALQQMSRALSGQRFLKRLPSHEEDYLLAFTGPGQQTVAVWTSGTPHTVSIDGQEVFVSGRPRFLPVSPVAVSGPGFEESRQQPGYVNNSLKPLVFQP